MTHSIPNLIRDMSERRQEEDTRSKAATKRLYDQFSVYDNGGHKEGVIFLDTHSYYCMMSDRSIDHIWDYPASSRVLGDPNTMGIFGVPVYRAQTDSMLIVLWWPPVEGYPLPIVTE